MNEQTSQSSSVFSVASLLLAFFIAAPLLTGCAGKGPMKEIPPAPKAPAVPPRLNVPLDAALQDAAKSELMSASRAPDPVIRANAMEAVQDTLGAEGGEVILRGLDDSDSLVRFAAAMSAGKLRLEAARERAGVLLRDADDNVKVGALFALHRLGDVSHSHDFERLARNDSQSVRGNVAIALGLLGEPSALRILRRMGNDREPAVRLQAAEAMWRLGDREGLQSLVVGTVSRYADEQALSVLALAQPRDSRVSDHILGQLTSESQEVALVAARALGMLGSDAGYGVAVAGAKTPDPRKKALAALAFGQIGRADAQPILAQLLKDENPTVKVAAATAILQLKK